MSTRKVRAAAFAALLSAAALVSLESRADPVAIDLRAFSGDAEVTIAPDGSFAQFVEVPVSVFVRRTNDPFAGDPQVIVASPGASVSFDYAFVEAPGAPDQFSAILFEARAGGGPFHGFLERFSVSNTQTGTAQIDLTPYVGMALGLEFELLDTGGTAGAVGSTATVSNVVLAVPEPAETVLLAAGLASLAGLQRRRRTRLGKPR